MDLIRRCSYCRSIAITINGEENLINPYDDLYLDYTTSLKAGKIDFTDVLFLSKKCCEDFFGKEEIEKNEAYKKYYEGLKHDKCF